MMKITDEMVEAATREYRDKLGECRRDMAILLSDEWKEEYGDMNRNPFAAEHYAMRAALAAAVQEGEEGGETCDQCQGNGEIVTDWERYLHAHEGDVGDEAVAECPSCNGTGKEARRQGPSHAGNSVSA